MMGALPISHAQPTPDSPVPSVAATPALPAPPPDAPAPVLVPAVVQDLRSFLTLGSVLHVAAHPDDENTHLLTYFSRGRGFRTAYLSLTRGDGGQNESGPEFGEKLGLARTHELLAARQLDHAEQFFTRALDFGYSKSVDETLRFWDRKAVLADVVRVFRIFRPDVVITRFSPQPGTTHGHHTASAVLAVEAFALAGDPKAFPEQLGPGGLTPWQPTRILHNNTPFGPRSPGTTPDPAWVTLEAGGLDPVSGEPFATLASRSRARHISQGFGNLTPAKPGPRTESFVLLAGAPATDDLFSSIDTTWSRYSGGDEIGRLGSELLASFDTDNLAANVPSLLTLRSRLAALPDDPVISAKRTQLDRILQTCLGLGAETLIAQAEVTPGEPLRLTHRLTQTFATSGNLTPPVPVRLVSVRYPALEAPDSELKLDATFSTVSPSTDALSIVRETTRVLPASTPPSQPYWLRAPASAGLNPVPDPALIGLPETPPAFPVEYLLQVGDQSLVLSDQPVQLIPDAPPAQARRKLSVIAPVSLGFPARVELFAPSTRRTLTVTVTAARAAKNGSLRLETPAGWSVEPARADFALAQPGDVARLEFTVTAPSSPDKSSLRAIATIEGQDYDQERYVFSYPHIPVQLLQPAARLTVVSLNLATRGQRIGYIPGAGDDTVASLQQMGFQVTTLRADDLTADTLRPFSAIVLGVRAWNENPYLATSLPALFAYCEAGGTVIAQYNRPARLKSESLAPYPLSIFGEAPRLRVSDENSPVTFLAPEHPALTTPNLLAAADFQGWVQERGAYFPSTWDEQKFIPLLGMQDPGEQPLNSSLLVARFGRGHYVYTSLAFFRQLPEGVPGAYRLLANLIALGQ